MINHNQNHNGNGASKLIWYMLTTAVAILIAVVGAWASSTNTRVSDLEKRQSATEARNERIESKLDFLVDAERRRAK